jgi:hypothetical protein
MHSTCMTRLVRLDVAEEYRTCNDRVRLSMTLLMTGSVHGTNDYIRWVGRSEEERAEQRKAARLCLDTSAHAGSDFQQLMNVLSKVSWTAFISKIS